MTERMRCLTVGCNPILKNRPIAEQHAEQTGHRIAKWPVRSAEGKRRARVRNRTGYYDKYNVGAKSAEARGIGGYSRYPREQHADLEAMAEWEDSRDD